MGLSYHYHNILDNKMILLRKIGKFSEEENNVDDTCKDSFRWIESRSLLELGRDKQVKPERKTSR